MSTARDSQSVCQARGGRRARFLRNRRASPAGESWRNARQPLHSTSLPSSTYAARPMALHFVCEGQLLGGPHSIHLSIILNCGVDRAGTIGSPVYRTVYGRCSGAQNRQVAVEEE